MTDIQSNTIPEEQEEWRPVVGWEDRYKVSNLGRIIKLKARGPRPNYPYMAQQVLQKYANIRFTKNNITKHHRVHKIVAAAFLGPRPEGKVVNHKDGVKLNNRAANLEYVTPKENSEHALAMGLYPAGDTHPNHLRPEKLSKGSRQGASKLKESDIPVIFNWCYEGVTFAEIARRLNVCSTTIQGIIKGKQWLHITQPFRYCPLPDSQLQKRSTEK